MENSYAVLAIVSIIAVVFISKIIFKKHPKQKFPPGPKPLPIIGNLNIIGHGMPHVTLHNLSKKYGDIIQLKFGKHPVLVASSPEAAKLFLKTHDQVFANRPPVAAGKYTAFDHSNIFWAPLGPYWRQARKILLAEVFKPSKVEFYEQIRVEERRELFSQIIALSGKPVMIRDHIRRYILSAACRTAFGERFSTAVADELQVILDEWFVLNGAFCIGDWIPWLSFLDLHGYVKKMKAWNKKFHRFLDREIDNYQARRKTKQDEFGPKGVADVLLKLEDDPNLEVQLTRDNIKGLILDLLVGGTDTTAGTSEWAIHEIMKQPRILKKVKEELDRVIGRNRWVKDEDLSKLPYLDGIMMETLRLHPPGTLNPPHYANEDCIVDGYNVSKGTTVFVNVWGIGRDPKAWDSPEEFLPERYGGKEIDILGHPALLAFSTGRRTCPGYLLALRNMGSLLANLLHGFDWKLPKGVESSTEEEYALTTHPKVHLEMFMERSLQIPF